MAYVNGTTHYNLPQTVGTDKRDWADTNQAFADIDAAIYGAVDDVAQAEEDISSLKTRMDTAEQNISTNTGNIAGLDTRVTTVEGAVSSLSGQVSDTRQDLEDMICAYNEASATSTHAYSIDDYFIYNDVLYRATQAIAIGDTIVPDTNCSTTNVTTEILAIDDLSGDVSQLQADVAAAQQDISDLESLGWTLVNSIVSDTTSERRAILMSLTNNLASINGDGTMEYCITFENIGEKIVFSNQCIESGDVVLTSVHTLSNSEDTLVHACIYLNKNATACGWKIFLLNGTNSTFTFINQSTDSFIVESTLKLYSRPWID